MTRIRTKQVPHHIPPPVVETAEVLTLEDSPADRPRPSTELPPPPSKASVVRALKMDEGIEEPRVGGNRQLSPGTNSRPISPTAAPEQEPPVMELSPPKQTKVPDSRAVSFGKDQEMPDKDPCEHADKKAKFEHEEGELQDADFDCLYCNEAEPVVETEAGSDFATVKFGSHRLLDSAKKFSNPEKAEKTPLRSSTGFNTAALLRSASHSLADKFTTPPTTNKRPPLDMRTPSKCSMSQPDVFGEDSSSDSEEDDK